MSLKEKLLQLLRITRQPVVRAYDGYADHSEVLIQGHVLSLSPMSRRRYRQNLFLNFFGMIRLFLIRPVRGARVILEFNGETHESTTDNEGQFLFETKLLKAPAPGWQPAAVRYVSAPPLSTEMARGECRVFVPHEYQYSFISDIDDTFLISHSTNLLKRLFVLFTKNARTRKPFEGVVAHYQALAAAFAPAVPNPFFYVSSSEWNLYDYIRTFCTEHQLPAGVFLLSNIKRFSQLLKTGQGRHLGKYLRISRILRIYPDHKYVLLGDNSQMDPEIYLKTVKEHRGKIHAVYIRNISPLKDLQTQKHLEDIMAEGVSCCYYRHSSEAIEHSRKIGLLPVSRQLTNGKQVPGTEDAD